MLAILYIGYCILKLKHVEVTWSSLHNPVKLVQKKTLILATALAVSDKLFFVFEAVFVFH